MPLTPFHGGPGLLIKAATPKHFSFIVFFASQIFIDCEVLWNLWQQNDRLHTTMHSYLGGLLANLMPFGTWSQVRCCIFFAWRAALWAWHFSRSGPTERTLFKIDRFLKFNHDGCDKRPCQGNRHISFISSSIGEYYHNTPSR